MIDPSLTFSSFVIGSSNSLAADAGRRVAALPGASYNPLVIVGRGGSGKTHLLHAIANEAQVLRGGEAVLMLSAAAWELDPPPEVDAATVLIDDLHLLADEPGAQQAFAAGALQALADGAQVVLSARAADSSLFNGALRRLIGSGLVVELEDLDRTLASHLITRFESTAGTRLAPEAREELIARTATPGELLRALGQVAAHFDENGQEITREQLLSVLEPAAKANPLDEFGAFLEDVTRILAVAVESVPWRRKLAEAIGEWEAQGIRTDRLKRALEGQDSPDVEALLEGFASDAGRLLEIRKGMGPDAANLILDDPDRLAAAEDAYRVWLGRSSASFGDAPAEVFRTVDPWFVDPDRLVLSAFDLEGRIPGDRR